MLGIPIPCLDQIIALDPDTDVTGLELETLTDGSNADSLHTHAGTNVKAGVELYGASIIGSASNAANQQFNLNLSQLGYQIGDTIRIAAVSLRGDLGGQDEELGVGFNGAANPKTFISEGGDSSNWSVSLDLYGDEISVIDIGSGVPGIQVFVSPDSTVNFSPTGMPNGWWWNIALNLSPVEV